jgi:DNA-binding NtrC family response regulator
MASFNRHFSPFNILRLIRAFKNWRLQTKLLVSLIPPVVLILALTGFATILYSNNYLDEALKRTVRLQTNALSHEIETFLGKCRQDLLIFAQRPVARLEFADFAKSRNDIGGIQYKEMGYFAKSDRKHIFLVQRGGNLVTCQDMSLLHPLFMLLFDRIKDLKKGEVWISDIMEGVYSLGQDGARNGEDSSIRVIRLATGHFGEDNSLNGIFLLSIDPYRIRNILSLFNSPDSPVLSYERSTEPRFNYLFDKNGWILFESEDIGSQTEKLSTNKARLDLSGTTGRPGLEYAFMPDYTFHMYWQMIEDVRHGKSGLILMADKKAHPNSMTKQYFLAYAPVYFNGSGKQDPSVYCGVAFADRSRLSLWAGYGHFRVMLAIMILSILIISFIIFGMSRMITRPIFNLAKAVNKITRTGNLRQITLPDHDNESSGLRNAVNQMIVTLKKQMEEIRIKDDQLELESKRKTARLEKQMHALTERLKSHTIDEIVGIGPRMDALKSELIKAACVDADVLIVGETGTGKQLTAEAIHKHSSRSQQPFISINCGALDENLLLDTLFGHIKGAFTEARTGRKGAFMAAHGGTLFLDEIGSASPKVQQALLRCLSLRKVRPLGSDDEIDVDVRLITATNVDPGTLIGKGLLREDLYYRLEVLTIRTPSLRNHKENIPVLVGYFLKQAGRLMNKEDVGITKGALEKMNSYHWPGNVRELMNCVTRSVAMVEEKLIQAEDITLGGERPVRLANMTRMKIEDEESLRQPVSQPRVVPIRHTEDLPPGLNARQRKTFPIILQKQKITRSEYQYIVGNNLPSRTALYDLSDLVKRGILEKTGRGPATRYYVAKRSDIIR